MSHGESTHGDRPGSPEKAAHSPGSQNLQRHGPASDTALHASTGTVGREAFKAEAPGAHSQVRGYCTLGRSCHHSIPASPLHLAAELSLHETGRVALEQDLRVSVLKAPEDELEEFGTGTVKKFVSLVRHSGRSLTCPMWPADSEGSSKQGFYWSASSKSDVISETKLRKGQPLTSWPCSANFLFCNFLFQNRLVCVSGRLFKQQLAGEL